MVKITNSLSCNFKDNLGKSRALTIDNPKEELTQDKVELFMDYLIASNAMMPDVDDPDVHYVLASRFSVTNKAVETVELG